MRTDVVFLDEASMVDLSLMAKLEDAVPRNAKLIFLGDPDQLASVEVGAIFGDICHTFQNMEEPEHGKTLITLSHQFRFSQTSGIGALARAIKTGDTKHARSLFGVSKAKSSSQEDAITTIPVNTDTRLKPTLRPHIIAGFSKYLTAQDPTQRLKNFDMFRILSAFRMGPYGARVLNTIVESILAEESLIDPSGPFYLNRPIMVTRNDYQLQLFNGDVGLIMNDEKGQPRAFFPEENGPPRGINPAHLPQHETAYCLTVHKAQGSEFDQVLLMLPPYDSKILTRELVYTGVTRARRCLTLAANETILASAMKRRIRRPSGIREAILKTMGTGDVNK